MSDNTIITESESTLLRRAYARIEAEIKRRREYAEYEIEISDDIFDRVFEMLQSLGIALRIESI